MCMVVVCLRRSVGYVCVAMYSACRFVDWCDACVVGRRVAIPLPLIEVGVWVVCYKRNRPPVQCLGAGVV